MKKFLVLFIVFMVTAGSGLITAQEKSGNDFNQSLNMCPLGIAFGVYSANYEVMIGKHHGLVFRLDYEAIPKTYSDANIESEGKAAVINYRYHFSGKLESLYLGAYGRYRIYEGDGKIENEAFDFDIKEFTFGLNVGKKWVWDSGFNINFTLGYGVTSKDKTQSKSTDVINRSVKVFEDEYDFINSFLGEFSIGYAF